jgi:hypothetical protein
MLSTSSSATRITAYSTGAPLGGSCVGCESGVNVGKGSGTAVSPARGVSSAGIGEPRYKVGVTVAGGGSGVVSASDWVQAARSNSNSKTEMNFEFMFFSLVRYNSRTF